jgi:hypothetical protein
LLTKLDRCRVLCCLVELASPLVFAERYHDRGSNSRGCDKADELKRLLLSRELRKVKDLQSLLWGERGDCRGDEVTDVFDLWETKLCFLGVDSDILSAKALEYSSDVTEEPRFGFAVYEYIIDVYFAYFVYKSVGNGSCRRKIPSHKLTGKCCFAGRDRSRG